MYSQGPTVGRINPVFTGPQDERDQSDKPRMGQSVPPPYYPNAGYQVPRANLNPNPSGYPNQPYGAPGGPQGPYVHPVMSAYPQGAEPSYTEVTVEPAVFVTPMSSAIPVPDYMCYSIFTMLCCCLPLGSAAVACSCTTQDANVAGHRGLAMSSSRSALILNNVALGLGLLLIITGVILILYFKGVFI